MTVYEIISSNKRRSFFLIGLFGVIMVTLGFAIDQLRGGGTFILPLAIIIALVYSLAGYFKGDKIALLANRAKDISRQDAPELYRIVENLTITTGMPMPKLYVIPSTGINAFATGRNPENASVAVTKGLINHLDRSEIEGVIAHELSHIKNYDILVMTIAAVFVGTAALAADLFIRSQIWGGVKSERNKLSPFIAIAGVILILLSPFVAKLIQLAISRRREYLADASGVLLTRYPDGLISALQKIKNMGSKVPTAGTATAHMYISNPLSKQSFGKLFATHPPIEERIAALKKTA